MARGQVDKAYATLERIARDNGKPMPLGRLVDQSCTSYTPVGALIPLEYVSAVPQLEHKYTLELFRKVSD